MDVRLAGPCGLERSFPPNKNGGTLAPKHTRRHPPFFQHFTQSSMP
jgi:hypothetical protein